jgi:hypothetical protein
MSVGIIPVLHGSAFWSQRTELDGVDYRLDFAWNARAGGWYLSLFLPDGTPVVGAFKLVSNRPLLLHCHALANVPPGEIWAHDPSGLFSVAGYSELGSEVELFYIDAEDLER